MTDRPYKTMSSVELKNIKIPKDYPKEVKYSVGQPMGALSSWAMLAITHHFILHACAWIAGAVRIGRPFTEYAVLGDDVVIWNKSVASRYLKVLKALGVEVGLAKSIISKTGKGLEFAKKTIVDGVNVSPIPLKAAASAHKRFSMFRNFVIEHQIPPLKALRFLGYGYKVDPSKNVVINRALDTASIIPRSYEDLKDIFDLSNRTPYDFAIMMKYPAAQVKRALVLLVHKELTDICHKAKEAMYSLLTFDCANYVNSIGPDQQRSAVVNSAVYSRVSRYIPELEALYRDSRAQLHRMEHLHEFYSGFAYDIPFTAEQNLEPYPLYFKHSMNLLFTGFDTLDRIQVASILNPKMGISKSITMIEEERTLRVWRRWSTILKKVKIVRGF